MVIEELDNLQYTEDAFLDLSEALDDIDYKTPRDKLSLHGVQGIPHQWLEYLFLIDRSQMVLHDLKYLFWLY